MRIGRRVANWFDAKDTLEKMAIVCWPLVIAIALFEAWLIWGSL